MSETKDSKKKSFADIFKNILKETKKEKDPKKEKEDLEKKPSSTENSIPEKDPAKLDNTVVLKEALTTNKSEKIIFYEEKKNSINDETIFDFVIKGGPSHSDLLVACASYRNSAGRGEPVALTCKWFNVTDNNELREIEGVTGAFYQPCADDIGTRICVQAVPNLGLKEYTGMPIFAEVGPLIIDSEIEQIAYENFDKSSVEFSIKIETIDLEIPPNFSLPYLPCEAFLEIKENNLTMFIVDDNEQKIELNKSTICSTDYPNIVLIKKSNNIFEMFFSEKEKVKCLTKTNKERDIIALSIRLLSGKQINEKNETIQTIKEENENDCCIEENKVEENSSSPKNSPEISVAGTTDNHENKENLEKIKRNESEIAKLKKKKIELYIKLEQLTKDVLRLTKDKENAKSENRCLNDSANCTKKELIETKEKLTNCTNNYYELLEENKHLNKTLELYMNEKLFLFQELDIYKKQIEEIEKMKLIEGINPKPANEDESRKRTPSNSIKSLSKEILLNKINDLNAGIIKLEAEIKEKNSELILKNQNIKEIVFEKEELLNEINYLKKKNECLIHEKVLNFAPQIEKEKNEENDEKPEIENPGRNSFETQINLKKTMDIKNLENLEDEIKKLKEKIKNQEITIETLKIGLSQEISKKNEKGKSKIGSLFSKNSPQKDQILKKTINDFNFLQKLVNVLTETIADKDLALENQKQINKELMKRLEESRNLIISEK